MKRRHSTGGSSRSNKYARLIPAAINTARNAYDAYFSGPAYSARTPSFAGSASRGESAPGKASGFLSTTLKPHVRRASAADVRGTSVVLEVGGELNAGASTATAGNTVCIGHASMPVHTAHIVMWRAIVKQVLIRMGQTDLSNFYAGLDGFSIGDAFGVVYSVGADSSFTSVNYVVAGGFSPETVAVFFADHFRTNFSTDLTFQQIYFQSKTPTPTGNTFWPPVFINLKDCMFTCYSKSALKVQNQSRGNLGGDEDAVDNNPIVGRAYYGLGNGSSGITKDGIPTTAGRPFVADGQYGAIAIVPTELVYQEPPPATHFLNVKLYGKALLEPGHIKTSRLTYKKTLKMTDAYRVMFSDDAMASHPIGVFGNFRFMIFEKMISSSTGSVSNAIKISYECQIEIGGHVTFKKDTRTSQLNSLSNYKNEV